MSEHQQLIDALLASEDETHAYRENSNSHRIACEAADTARAALVAYIDGVIKERDALRAGLTRVAYARADDAQERAG